MSVKMTVSLVLGAVFLLIYILKCCKSRSVIGVEIKSIVSVIYIATAALAIWERPENYKYGLLIIIGGVLGLLGDVYLDQKWIHLESKDEYLALGFLNFGVGHIFYIVGAAMVADFGVKDMLIPLVAAFGISVFNMMLSKPLKQDFGKFKIVVFTYGLILGFMAVTAFMAYIKTRSTAFLIYTIAGLSFFASDIVLSAIYFTKDGKKVTVARFIINIIAYYLAQYLIAITPYFVEA